MTTGFDEYTSFHLFVSNSAERFTAIHIYIYFIISMKILFELDCGLNEQFFCSVLFADNIVG